jgi:hypothetical protein
VSLGLAKPAQYVKPGACARSKSSRHLANSPASNNAAAA